jgi:hypothetical protein
VKLGEKGMEEKLYMIIPTLSEGLPQDKSHGMAMIVAKDIAEFITDTEYVNERILKVNIQLQHIKITIIQVYAPQQGKTTQEKNHFYAKHKYQSGKFIKINLKK